MKKFLFTMIAFVAMAVGANAQAIKKLGELEKVVEVSVNKSVLYTNALQ